MTTNPVPIPHDDLPCTDCGDTGISFQTERRCPCQPPIEEAREQSLADLIQERLLGVAPDDQDLVLEDDDWRLIIAALTPEPAKPRDPVGEVTDDDRLVANAIYLNTREHGSFPTEETAKLIAVHRHSRTRSNRSSPACPRPRCKEPTP